MKLGRHLVWEVHLAASSWYGNRCSRIGQRPPALTLMEKRSVKNIYSGHKQNSSAKHRRLNKPSEYVNGLGNGLFLGSPVDGWKWAKTGHWSPSNKFINNRTKTGCMICGRWSRRDAPDGCFLDVSCAAGQEKGTEFSMWTEIFLVATLGGCCY